MTIFIIANYSTVLGEKGSSRFTYLADLFAQKGHQVTFITSSFSHRTKKNRDEAELNKLTNGKYKIKLINVPGYKKHLGLKRLLSIRRFGINLRKELSSVKELPDIVYFSFPTFSSARIATKFALKNKIPPVIDIVDVWPEALLSVLKIPTYLFNIIFLPYTIKANRIYKSASAIIGVSETYVARARKVNNSGHYLSVFLGADLKYFDNCLYSRIKQDGEIWLIYIGTISYSYDLITVLKAMNILIREQKLDYLKVKILGSGPHKDKLEQMANSLELPVEFMGFLEYNEMINYLKNSDIALNAIVKGAQQSITYKIGDYVSAGLPILNSSENIEFRKMIVEEEIGINYNAGEERDLTEKIMRLLKNNEKMLLYGKNSRRIAEHKFDRRKTYDEIIELVEKMIK
ncbi:MAG: glycosyltransferase family 4 protein [Saonia sp.]